MSVGVGGARLKFLEASSFRELPAPPDFDEDFIFHGSVFAINGQAWRVVGSAPNPNRSTEFLVFVEPAPERRVSSEPGPNRRRRASDHC